MLEGLGGVDQSRNDLCDGLVILHPSEYLLQPGARTELAACKTLGLPCLENFGFPDPQNPETKFGARSAPNLGKIWSGWAKFGAVRSSGTTGDDANLGPRYPESQAAFG